MYYISLMVMNDLHNGLLYNKLDMVQFLQMIYQLILSIMLQHLIMNHFEILINVILVILMVLNFLMLKMILYQS